MTRQRRKPEAQEKRMDREGAQAERIEREAQEETMEREGAQAEESNGARGSASR